MKTWTVLIFLLTFHATAATKVQFVDWCSEKEIKVSTPNGTRLLVELTQIDPTDNLELSVTFRPAGIIEDLDKKDQATYNYNLVPQDNKLRTLINLPKYKWMWQVEQRHSEYRIWDAEVKWVQARAKKAGSSVTTFYRAPKNGPYFQLRSEGLCQWEQEGNISSKLYENTSTTWMNVTRESGQTWDTSSSRGLTLGYDNNTGANMPLAPTITNNAVYGWLFGDWQKQFNKQQIFRIERKYVLNRDEAGIFLNRLSFNRHSVKKFEWREESGACGNFVPVSEGFLDIGIMTEDFIVVPKTFHPRPEVLKEYLNTVRPPINNCEASVGTGAQHASMILPAGADGLLFYYETNHLKGEL